MIDQLIKHFNAHKDVSFIQRNELIIIAIDNSYATAEIALQGAQISRYQPKGKPDLLFLSDACEYKKNSPLRGGIPICWPWFGDLDKNPESLQKQINSSIPKPAHGFVRSRDWELATIISEDANSNEISDKNSDKSADNNSDHSTRIKLIYRNTVDEPLWPFNTTLHYEIEVGATLSVKMTVENNDSKPFTYSQALHSYFTVKDIDDLCIKGFDSSTYTDALDGWQLKTQQGDIKINSEVDRIYHSAPNPIELHSIKNENENGKLHSIESSGTANTVIWNPWIDKAKRLSQFNDDEYQQMVCIESANALDGSITLQPGEKHSLWLRLS